MSWTEHHAASEHLARRAELAALRNDTAAAEELYSYAAEAEVRALGDLDPSKARTLGITVVSAVALWFRARQYGRAKALAHQWLATDRLPAFAEDELQGLLQAIWSASSQEVAGVEFVQGDVLIAIKGGDVVFGGAPLDLIVRKVEEVKALFYRTAEMLLGQPHRKRGQPSPEVQSVFEPWLFQAPAGSYQFAVRVRQPRQLDLFNETALHINEVVSTCLAIVKTSVEDPEGAFKEYVKDPEYQMTFLRLARNLAPTGARFGQIAFRDATQRIPDPIALVPQARAHLNEAIRGRRPQPLQGAEHAEQLTGVLRAVHLDRDWLEIAPDAPNEGHVRVVEVGELVDDVIGPMVNHRVTVEVVRDARGRYLFRDIQPFE